MNTRTLLLCALLLPPLTALCNPPDNGSISVNTTNSLFISYNNVEELLSRKIVENALQLNVKTSKTNYAVYGSISFIDPSQDMVFSGKVALKLKTKTSYNAAVSAAEVPLSNVPVLLFTQPATNNTEHFNFLYDIVVGPFASQLNPGNFSYTIKITMTEP